MADLIDRARAYAYRSGFYAPGHDLDDLAMTAILRGLRALNGGPWREHLFWAAARRGLVDLVRQQTRARAIRQFRIVPLSDRRDPGDDGGILAATDRVALQQVIDAADLSALQAQAVEHCLLTERNSTEAALHLGRKPKTIDNAAHKARLKLREVVGEGSERSLPCPTQPSRR